MNVFHGVCSWTQSLTRRWKGLKSLRYAGQPMNGPCCVPKSVPVMKTAATRSPTASWIFARLARAMSHWRREDLVDVIEPGHRADVPLLDVADALGVFHPRGRHEGDVAEGGAAEIGQDRLVRVAMEPVRLGGVVLEHRVA